jgi:hypothetical protein
MYVHISCNTDPHYNIHSAYFPHSISLKLPFKPILMNLATKPCSISMFRDKLATYVVLPAACSALICLSSETQTTPIVLMKQLAPVYQVACLVRNSARN